MFVSLPPSEEEDYRSGGAPHSPGARDTRHLPKASSSRSAASWFHLCWILTRADKGCISRADSASLRVVRPFHHGCVSVLHHRRLLGQARKKRDRRPRAGTM